MTDPTADVYSQGPGHLASLVREADHRLCSLHRIVSSLRDGIESTRHVGPVFDLQLLEMRATYLSAVRSIHTRMQKMVDTIGRYKESADEMHQGEIRVVQESLSRASTESPDTRLVEDSRNTWAEHKNGWESESSTRKTGNGQPELTGASARPPAKDPAPPRGLWSSKISTSSSKVLVAEPTRKPTPARQNINVSAYASTRAVVPIIGDIGLEAVYVPRELTSCKDILAAVAPGEIHFIPQWTQFAVRVGGIVFHANVGHIYPIRRRLRVAIEGRTDCSDGLETYFPKTAPERIKPCRKGDQCSRRRCTFFHDPETCPGSSDVRNFTSDSWTYYPSATPGRAPFDGRRFGSIEFLESDLCAMTEQDVQRFLHQTAHDIVCSFILHNFVLKKRKT